MDITGTTNYTLSLTEIPASLDNIKFLNDGVLYDAAMSMDLQANSAMLFAQVPEPGSTALALAGLAPPPVEEAQKKCPIEALRFLQALMDKEAPRRRNAGGASLEKRRRRKGKASIPPRAFFMEREEIRPLCF